MAVVNIEDKKVQLAEELRILRRAALAPPIRMPLDEWADTYRQLPSESSSMPGPWRTAAVEVARGVFRAFTEKGVHTITGCASAQIFKTSACETAIGRFMHLEPCPMLIFEPSNETVDAFDGTKLEPMIRATPVLRDMFGGWAGLTKKNEKFLKAKKEFNGGYIEVLTAGSPSNLAMRSAKVVMFDEVDKMRVTRDGDPIALGEERLKRFRPNALSVRMSTPTITGESRIMQEYLESDQRKPYVCCPNCDEWHVMEWEQVSWEKDASGKARPETAKYFCKGCGVAWTEAERIHSITTPGAVSWRQTRKFSCCDETQDPERERLWKFEDRQQSRTEKQFPVGYAICKHCGSEPLDSGHAGFWAWEAYNPVSRISEIVKNFIASKGDRSQLQNFINSKLARTFDREVSQTAAVNPEHLAERAEPPWPGVPAGVKVVTLGADVQGDRIECEIVGWGDGDESWSLDYQVIAGDPRTSEPWAVLNQILNDPLEGEDGKRYFIQSACIDAGYQPDEVLAFTAPRRGRRVWATMGRPDRAGTRSPIWPARSSVSKKGGQLFMLGTQSAKDRISSHLQVHTPGPGFMHVPANRDRRWFEQLVAEKLVRVALPGGREGTMWQSRTKGKRNEAVDCRAYAIAALESLRRAGVVLAASTATRDQVAAVAAAKAEAASEETDAGEREVVAPIAKPVAKKSIRKPLAVRRPRPGSIWGG